MRFSLLPTAMVVLYTVSLGYAAEPEISYNVHVLQNATAKQCTPTWEDRQSPQTGTSMSGYGSNSFETSPVVRSCNGCGIQQSSGDCVCQTCYDYFID